MKEKSKIRRLVLPVSFFILIGSINASATIFSNENSEKKSTTNEILQQTQVVKGTVVDANGSPIVGANISTSNGQGTITDADGNFTLRVPKGTVIKISYIGFIPQSVVVNSSIIKVTLREDVESLDEVVVVGYGSVKKSDLTGSVSSINNKTFLDQPASSANSILVGRAPGVTVKKGYGDPGTGSTIRIRGANSIYGGNDPLIVVDGNYSSMPDMYDIKSIEILKDASATAIYGSRGANGVILVTTNRGIEGKPALNVYTNFSVNSMPKKYDMLDAYDFASFNKSVGAYPFTDDEVASYKGQSGTDWQDEIFQTGFAQDYKVTLSGGAKNVRYYVSPSYSKTTGTIINTNSENYGLNTKVDVDLSSRVTLQIESNLAHSGYRGIPSGYGSKTSIPLMGALVWSPTESVYESDGTYNRLGVGTGTIINPVLMTSAKKTNGGNSGTGIGNIKVKIIDGLVFDGKASYNFYNGTGRYFESKNYNGLDANASQNSSDEKTWLLNGFLTYTKTFAQKHELSAMAGYEETKYIGRGFSASADKLPIESVGWDNLSLAAPNIGVSSWYSNSALRSYFGRVNYNYDSRYYVTANFRADGSSKFRKDNRFGYFPSFSLAWKLTEEKFMKDQNIFQSIKLRGGWGKIGNQAVSSYSTYSSLSNKAYSWGDVTQAGYIGNVGGNPDLKWETTKQYNIGLDLTTWNNRLNVTLDYYNKKTTDLLAPISVPGYSGGDSEYGQNTILSNVGSVRNKGFEFNVSAFLVQSKDWNYDININGAINKNKVLDLGENEIIYGDRYAAGLTSTSPFVLLKGQPIGTIYGMKYLGIWQQNEADEAAKFGQTPGDYKYEDVNGDNNYTSADEQVLGNTNPTFTWGFNNHLSYKNFDFNLLFEGVHNRDILNWTYMVMNERTVSSVYTGKDATDRWSETNTNAKFAKVGSTNRLNPVSSQYMEDGSYVKLRNISLSYTLPKQVTRFATLRLSVSAQNILTFTKYKGYDPEITSSPGSDVNSGMDWFAYPNPKSVSFGLTITY